MPFRPRVSLPRRCLHAYFRSPPGGHPLGQEHCRTGATTVWTFIVRMILARRSSIARSLSFNSSAISRFVRPRSSRSSTSRRSGASFSMRRRGLHFGDPAAADRVARMPRRWRRIAAGRCMIPAENRRPRFSSPQRRSQRPLRRRRQPPANDLGPQAGAPARLDRTNRDRRPGPRGTAPDSPHPE